MPREVVPASRPIAHGCWLLAAPPSSSSSSSVDAEEAIGAGEASRTGEEASSPTA